MVEAGKELPPASFQAAVATIKCDIIDENVSIMVNKDWTARCIWFSRFKEAQDAKGAKKLDRHTRPKVSMCKGPLCPNVVAYKDRLMEEEQRKGQQAAS